MLVGEDEESARISLLKREFEASLARVNFLEKENHELRQEIVRLRAQVNNAFKSHDVDRKSVLWKKVQSSPESKIAADKSQQKLSFPAAESTEAVEPGNKKEMAAKSAYCYQFQQKPICKLPSLPAGGPAPPPPPPPPPSKTGGSKALRRVPAVMELYRSLVKRDAQKERRTNAIASMAALNPKNMIGEIENRSTHLLAVKSDVETHGEAIEALLREVESAAFTEISEVETFVKWLDGELSSLVDERAVLKHFPQWPERKADALREAACSYRELKNLESEVLSFKDNPKQLLSQSLRKIQALQDRLERSVGNIERLRDGASKRYRELHIPWAWMLDTGVVGQLKLSSMELAKQYMGRVAMELECHEPPQKQDLILQGVRFAYRVHQFAGGFDAETVKAFEGIKLISTNIESQ
ncbi:protein CHUP1, chloroplastic [Ipomoea triloba]|uniref:protein CHUP1, chloroplastic n=1 Tax=Ipomoea triloba TaxID=35885 RepID=UPI00125D2E7B|nr:protein CHUP1, chloroplastic [Ipomoea triloba]